MKIVKRISILLTILTISFGATATDFALKIRLGTGSANEERAKALIESFERKFDLRPYFFTKEILIQSRVIPRSHPVLTLNTRQIDDPDRYLSLLLHEQIHWFFSGSREAKTKAFIERIRLKYPTVPSREHGGANNIESTYLHFAICYYELEALTRYIGQEKAERIFKTNDVYSWIYKEVLSSKEAIKTVLNQVGLQWEDAIH